MPRALFVIPMLKACFMLSLNVILPLAFGRSPLIGTLLEAPMNSFHNRLLWCKDKLKNEDLVAFTTIAWAIWFARNKMIFQEESPNTQTLVSGFLKLTSEYKQLSSKTRACPHQHSVISGVEWLPPSLGFVKINFDAGLLQEGVVGLGMVMRDTHGKLLATAVKRINAQLPPAMAEACAGLFDLQIANLFKYEKVIFESDVLSLINLLSHPKQVLAPIGVVLDDIKAVVSCFSHFNCNHVKRKGNSAAHFMARMIPTNGVDHIFVEHFPQGLLTLLGLDH